MKYLDKQLIIPIFAGKYDLEDEHADSIINQ